jgi:regulator of protease activity HflC (stomatin/prohibitin superfamily)
MLDKILDFLMQIWNQLAPFHVIEHYNRGVMLRLGKFRKIVEPGLLWKIPFVDQIIEHTVVATTIELSSQSLTTKDEKNIVARAVVKYEIKDIEVFLLDVYDAVDAISDMTMGIIKKVITNKSWEECKEESLDDLITKKARVEARKWGIEIIAVTLTDLGVIRSIRLFNERS